MVFEIRDFIYGPVSDSETNHINIFEYTIFRMEFRRKEALSALSVRDIDPKKGPRHELSSKVMAN
ncbi:hypothetical protein EFP84_08225 [Leptospira kmetyi]|uniref:Uncharacterized protein n=1 Tax=Leptospira kmetyi TaxID=408139 RepID=A0AAD0UMC5_9LEPT|nr:hypothetical protein EFP84_08225 [Leptospira kmetyi]